MLQNVKRRILARLAAAHYRLSHQPTSTSSPSSASLATSTKLIHAYFTNGLPSLARETFDKIPQPDIVAFTALISGFISSNLYNDAWFSFRDMLSRGILPNAYAISSVLRVRCAVSCVTVHGIAVKIGVDRQIYVTNALIAYYASYTSAGIQIAAAIFDEMDLRTEVTWTTMIAGYLRTGDGSSALDVFRKMLQEGVSMNAFSCSAALRASAAAGSSLSAKQLHSAAVKSGFATNLVVGNTLLDSYCRFKSVRDANLAFEEILVPDLITWNTMISFLEKINPAKSLELLVEMQVGQAINPNCFTFTSIAAACGNLGLLTAGEQLHAAALRRGFHANLPLNNALIDMYAKCGKIRAGVRVFESMSSRDLVSWTTAMMAYGSHGYAAEAIGLFSEMIAAGEKPDRVVLLGLIMACSHAGLVDQGIGYFTVFYGESSVEEQEIYGCLVDLLGRKGKIEEAMDLVEKMPVEADERVWRALLGACRIHGNAAVGKIAARKVEEKDPGSVDACSLLSNILAGEGEWAEFARMRRKVKGKKEVGMSWAEINGRVSCFVAGDGRHPEMELVYGVVEMLTETMKWEDE